MCSSSNNVSMSAFRRFAGREIHRLRQHALQRFKVSSIIVGECLVNFVWKHSGVINGGLYFSFRPVEVRGHGSSVRLIAADEQHQFPHCERASLYAGLPPSGGIAEVDKGKFRTSQTF